MAGVLLTAKRVGAVIRKTGIKQDIQTSKVYVGNTKYEDSIPDDSVEVSIGVFFDGTLNNRKNTEARIEHEKKENNQNYIADIAEKYIDSDGSSYENDYSNVSKSEPYYDKKNEEKQKRLSVYIEGIGTENYEDDSLLLGAAMGKGDTGVLSKVKKGCQEAVKEIRKNVGNRIDTINLLTIDVFGFSRGAAAARNFVYEVSKRKGEFWHMKDTSNLRYHELHALAKKTEAERKKIYVKSYEVDGGFLGVCLQKKGITVKRLAIRFVGLYDTVASYGISHDNDTKELHLDAIKNARYVFQIAADDEHRANFRLTNINSAGSRGKEVFFPGVHSDIGGGYRDNAQEYFLKIFQTPYKEALKRYKKKLIEEGWFTEEELVVHEASNYGFSRMYVKRENIRNQYSFIPLQIMSEYATEYCAEFNIEDIKQKHRINNNPLLIWAKQELDKYVQGERGKLLFTNKEEAEKLKALRQGYFHTSAHYNGGILGIYPNKPENGERQINDG